MNKLKEYLKDGADYQARAVLAYLQPYAEIQDSWNEVTKQYKAELEVARWENCREQGYIVSLYIEDKQLNIAFFGHRNSDSIHAIKWQQYSINSLTIDTANFGDLYIDKWDTSYSVKYNEAYEMAEWILKEFNNFYKENKEL